MWLLQKMQLPRNTCQFTPKEKKNTRMDENLQIERIDALFKVIQNNNINNSSLYYKKYYKDYLYIYRNYNQSLLKPTEIKIYIMLIMLF